MILRWDEFLTESMLMESKLQLSTKFMEILRKMAGNKIADAIISRKDQEIEGIIHNYIDVSDKKDEILFIPDRKAEELVKNSKKTFRVVNSSKYLTHAAANDKIFKRLGYEKEGRECWAIDEDSIVEIMSETVSNVTGNTYCMVSEVGGDRIGVINKTALEEEDSLIWKSGIKMPFRINKFARSILKKAGIVFTDQEIEEFGNLYKSTYDYMQDILRNFEVVKGNLIAHWYDGSNYSSGGSSLGNSCMKAVDSDFFDIYCKNDAVSLVILKDERDKTFIKGRAILWQCNINGEDSILMDRIYTAKDEDVGLFIKYAEKNDWWRKAKQNIDESGAICKGDYKKNNPEITVKLQHTDFENYPYMDTLLYLNIENETLTNFIGTENTEGIYQLRSTNGGFDRL